MFTHRQRPVPREVIFKAGRQELTSRAVVGGVRTVAGKGIVPDDANSFIEAEVRVAHRRGRLYHPTTAGVLIDESYTDEGGGNIHVRDHEWPGEVGK